VEPTAGYCLCEHRLTAARWGWELRAVVLCCRAPWHWLWLALLELAHPKGLIKGFRMPGGMVSLEIRRSPHDSWSPLGLWESLGMGPLQ